MITAVLPGYYPTLVQNVAATPLVTPAPRTNTNAISPTADLQQSEAVNPAVTPATPGVNPFNALDNVNDLLVNQFRTDTLGEPQLRAQVRGGGTITFGNESFLGSGNLLGTSAPDQLNGAPILGSGELLGDNSTLNGVGFGSTLINPQISASFDTTGVLGNTALGDTTTTGLTNAALAGDNVVVTAPLVEQYNEIGAAPAPRSSGDLLDVNV